MKKYSAFVFVIASLAISSPVSAIESLYVGVEAGSGTTELGFSSSFFVPDETSADEDDCVVGVYGGVPITKNVGVELAYDDLGTTSFRYAHTSAPLPPPASPIPARSEWLATSRKKSRAPTASITVMSRPLQAASNITLVLRSLDARVAAKT